MAELTFVCLYRSYMEDLEPYTMAQRGRLITAMMRYFFEGEEPSFHGPERYIWPILRSQCDRDQEKYQKICQKNAQNARKRWEQEGYARMPPHDFAYQMDSKHAKENESENENKSENESEKENENDNHQPSTDGCFLGEQVLPSGGNNNNDLVGEEELRSFCEQEGIRHVDPVKFVNYYRARGWMIGSNPLKDWRAAVRVWEQKGIKENCNGLEDRIDDRAYNGLFL